MIIHEPIAKWNQIHEAVMGIMQVGKAFIMGKWSDRSFSEDKLPNKNSYKQKNKRS